MDLGGWGGECERGRKRKKGPVRYRRWQRSDGGAVGGGNRRRNRKCGPKGVPYRPIGRACEVGEKGPSGHRHHQGGKEKESTRTAGGG